MNKIVFLYIILKTIEFCCGVERMDFPENIIFSAATAAYQVEGAWNLGGKGESIWDHIVHNNPSFIADKSNGDVACDSFHKYQKDIDLIQNIGFKMYRFSISWPRILPTGRVNNVSTSGIEYYNKLIDALIEKGIEPMVTLYHWDIPQRLQELGGWTNPIMASYFEDYARVVFSTFGKKVKWWITINEPMEVVKGYGSDEYAPNLGLHGYGDYLAAHTLLLAHAAAYRLYETQFKPSQHGRVSFSLSGSFCLPKTHKLANIKATERYLQFQFGWFAHPVYSKEGGYPDIMVSRIATNSKAEGLPRSRLPPFSPSQIKFIRGTYDFFGLNHYTTMLCSEGEAGEHPSWERDSMVTTSMNSSWPSAASTWLKVYPEGLRDTLKWIKNEYGNISVFITENGYSDFHGTDDSGRINYLKGYLDQMRLAIVNDKCHVIGYTIWSLIDNFEWRSGYKEKFGLVQVDFSSRNRTRTMKKSAEYIKSFLAKYYRVASGSWMKV